MAQAIFHVYLARQTEAWHNSHGKNRINSWPRLPRRSARLAAK